MANQHWCTSRVTHRVCCSVLHIGAWQAFYPYVNVEVTMHRYGGVYVDLDMEALQPIDPLVANLTVALAQMGDDDSFEHCIPNAFMASRPGHTFWMFVVAEILRAASDTERVRHTSMYTLSCAGL